MKEMKPEKNLCPLEDFVIMDIILIILNPIKDKKDAIVNKVF
jgi:hypothetical protein